MGIGLQSTIIKRLRKEVRRVPVGFYLYMASIHVAIVIDVRAASFDCNRATTEIEKMVCADEDLSNLDDQLGDTYAEALSFEANVKQLKKQQRDWLKKRNRCRERACLIKEYKSRIEELSVDHPLYTPIEPRDISEFEIDCMSASAMLEKIFCQTDKGALEKLITRQREIMLYELQWALMRNKDNERLRSSQRQWQDIVRDKCTDYKCLMDAYSKRSSELQVMSERPNSCYVLQSLLDDRNEVRPVWRDEVGNIRSIEPVCQALEDNLNQFCSQPPMACQLHITPRFSRQFVIPEWRLLRERLSTGMVEEFIRAPWEGSDISEVIKDRIWQEDRIKVQKALAEKRISFSTSNLDIYNLGRKYPAYRLDYGNCRANNPQLAQGSEEWARPITPAPVQIQYSPKRVENLFRQYAPLERGTILGDAFLYGGQTYMYLMSGNWDGTKSSNRLIVNRYYKEMIGKTKVALVKRNICIFDYQPIAGERK